MLRLLNKKILLLFLFFTFLFLPNQSLAQNQPKYWKHFKEAGEIYGIDPKILAAIGMHESRLKCQAINKANRNKSLDVGIMQINSCHFPVLKKKLKDLNRLYDPKTNINVGGWVLKSCMKKYGVTWKAIDCYNKGARRAHNKSKYINDVYKQYKKIKYQKW